MRPSHIPVIDHLRGIAASLVCLFHLSCGNRTFLPAEDPVRYFSSFGWLGVEMFFAISGFIIPYSLYLRSYKVRNASDFFVRRAKRIEPPYILCLFIVVALNYAASFAPGFRGQPFVFDWRVFLAHFGYLNSVLELGWYNPVFWTLAIEFQFYVFVALIYPLISHLNLAVRTISIVVISLVGFVGNNNSSLLFHWLPLFSIGMIAFQYYTQHNTTQHSTVQYSTVQYSTVQYNTVQYNTVQYNTVRYICID